MTRDDAIAIIQQQLGFRTDLNSVIITNMKLAQRTLEMSPTKPWFLLSELQTKRTTPTDDRVALPDDFLIEAENMVVKYIPDDEDSDPVPLEKYDYDQLAADFAEEEPGEPQAYAIQGNYLRIFPLPDDDYLLQIMNYQFDTVLDSNVENGFLKWIPSLLIGAAGLLVARAARDKDAIAAFQEMWATGMKILYAHNEAREHANRSYQKGGPH